MGGQLLLSAARKRRITEESICEIRCHVAYTSRDFQAKVSTVSSYETHQENPRLP